MADQLTHPAPNSATGSAPGSAPGPTAQTQLLSEAAARQRSFAFYLHDIIGGEAGLAAKYRLDARKILHDGQLLEPGLQGSPQDIFEYWRSGVDEILSAFGAAAREKLGARPEMFEPATLSKIARNREDARDFTLEVAERLGPYLRSMAPAHGALIAELTAFTGFEAEFSQLFGAKIEKFGAALEALHPEDVRLFGITREGWNAPQKSFDLGGRIDHLQQIADIFCDAFEVRRTYVMAPGPDATGAGYSKEDTRAGLKGTVLVSQGATGLGGSYTEALLNIFHELGHHLEHYGQESLMKDAAPAFRKTAAKILGTLTRMQPHRLIPRDSKEAYRGQLSELSPFWLEGRLQRRFEAMLDGRYRRTREFNVRWGENLLQAARRSLGSARVPASAGDPR